MVIGQVAAPQRPERPPAAGQGSASPTQAAATASRPPAAGGTSFQRLGSDVQALLVRAQGETHAAGGDGGSAGHVQHVAAVLREVFAHLHSVQKGSVQTGQATSTTA